MKNFFSILPSIAFFFFFWFMKIYYCHVFTIKTYDLGLSFLPLYKAKRETLATLTTLKGIPFHLAFPTSRSGKMKKRSYKAERNGKLIVLGVRSFIYSTNIYWTSVMYHVLSILVVANNAKLTSYSSLLYRERQVNNLITDPNAKCWVVKISAELWG